MFVSCSSFTCSDLIVDGNRQNRIPAEKWVNQSIYLLSCIGFTLTSVRSNNALCDGFFLDADNVYSGYHPGLVYANMAQLNIKNRCNNGKLINCSADNAFRDDMSICFAANIQVIGGVYSNANGTDPRSGVDVEADGPGSPGCENILFKGVSFVGNEGHGLLTVQVAGTYNITADGCYFSKNKGNAISVYAPQTTVRNCVIYDFPIYQALASSNVPGIIGIQPGANNCVITGNTIANIKSGQTAIIVNVPNAIVTNNKIYDFSGTAISPASFNAGNDIQQGKIIADPGVPSNSVISINSSGSVAVPTNGKFGYKVKYLNLTNVPTVSFTWLKKPSWVTTQIDSAFGTAPATPGTDTLKVVATAGSSSDTPAVVITIAYYKLLEAETGTLITPMAVMADPLASGGNCISAASGINTITKNIEASYTVTNMPAGTYFVWLKMSIPVGSTTNNFGIFVGFGTALNANYLKPKVTDTYTWVRGSVSFTLPAGTNTFILGHGLAGAKIDQIILTTSWEFTLPANYTSIQEKQTKNQKIGLGGANIIPRTLSGGRINFMVNGIGAEDFALNVFNIAGSRVWAYQQKGSTVPDYQVIWDGTDSQLKPVRSGVYVASMQTINGLKQVPIILQR
jgi:hypothetical protein